MENMMPSPGLDRQVAIEYYLVSEIVVDRLYSAVKYCAKRLKRKGVPSS
jgi:hypothetical protein